MVVKTYICVFVSLTTKAVHLELVTDLTTDNGTNFVGANRELQDLSNFLKKQMTQQQISRFCTSEQIQ